MARRARDAGGNAPRAVRGPQSALTSYLAANNISAAQIRDTFEDRQRRNQQQAPQVTDPNPAAAAAAAAPTPTAEAVEAAQVEETVSKKRKRASDAKGKAALKSKSSKKTKKKDDDSEDEYRDLGAEMYQKSQPRPGQLDNCELCNKRFTVTAYSRTGPDGGLVCTPCGKDLKAEDKKLARPKNAGQGKKRRLLESNKLDGIVQHGPKPLQQLCIEKVAQHHSDIDEFGDIPDDLLSRLSEIFSKRRVITPHTLPLFVRSDSEVVAVNDCAQLEEADYRQILSVAQNLRKLVLRNASQFKDKVVEYMISKTRKIEYLQLYGANLISDAKWHELFTTLGSKLTTIKLEWLDAAFDNSTVATIVTHCPNLTRFKLKYCRRLTPRCLESIASLQKLEHLSILFPDSAESPQPEHLAPLITALGPRLKTLSLENCRDADDSVIAAIRTSCSKLSKLRLTNLDQVTDDALTSLFTMKDTTSVDGTTITPASVVPGLTFLDLSSARSVINDEPAGPRDGLALGLCASSFTALMAHSGASLAILCIPSCRHISHAALVNAFGPQTLYPILRELNISFVPSADTAVVAGVFRACPQIRKLIAFGCFSIEDVAVPPAVALIGVPRAGDAIERIGDFVTGGAEGMGFLDDLAGVAPPMSIVGAVGA